MRKTDATIRIAKRELEGHFYEPRTGLPGVLFIHGWNGSQDRDAERSRAISRLGCVCLTFDMRGHGLTQSERPKVTRTDNLEDICAAYDKLVTHPSVDASCILVVASSYGAYLSTFLTAVRPVKWLAMRVPALYSDDDWDQPKDAIDREDLRLYRSTEVPLMSNRALKHCQHFGGDVLIVESEKDERIPHPTIASYLASFKRACSITHRIIEGADHSLSRLESRRVYDEILVRWIKEMVLAAR
ncbi:MAG: alpha/beta fold hydrolase [Paracoccaceae bacterium]|nr:alpha/beta fold hydrolase [Paracoccaceae bacterium]